MYIQRSIEPVLKKATQQFPAVVLTGPRQSGKTTVLQHLFSETHRYVSLDQPDLRATALEDPRGFLDFYQPPVIVDEVQYAPEILTYVKASIDQRRDLPGQYLLTGSSNLLLLERVTETLAGRTAILNLLPLSFSEVAREPQRHFPWERKDQRSRSRLFESETLWKLIVKGTYPELHARPDIDSSLWHVSYMQTYLERDVRTMRQVGDLNQFQNFLRSLAAMNGQLLNLSEMARDLGIATNTAKGWLSILEATFQVMIIRPYHANITKRLVKRPKVYFADLGTLTHLTGIQTPEQALRGPMGGSLLETAAISEIVKRTRHRGTDPRLYFWRTATGVEVDMVLETGEGLLPIEVKLSATPRPRMARSIHHLTQDLPGKVREGYLLHTGREQLPLPHSVTALPMALL